MEQIIKTIAAKTIHLKPRAATSHKGQNGKILIIGGSEDYIGAPALVGMSAKAALRSGSDLVMVAAPEKVAWAINCISPDIITHKLKCRNFMPRNCHEILKLAEKADVVEIGNGISFTPGAKEFMRRTIKQLIQMNKKIVVDAAAIRVIRLQDLENCVLLPHAKELEALLENSSLARINQDNVGTNTIIIKGHPETTIISKSGVALNKNGNAGMTHGGTGDVLAGIVSALWSQGNDAFTSACAATFVNGKAADNLFKKKGFGFIASDLVEEIPNVLKSFQNRI